MRFPKPLAVLAFAAFAAPSLCAQSTSPDDVEKAIRAKLKSDLRNLVTAQEAYYADHTAYADAMENLKFRPSSGSNVSLVATQNNAWAAVATDPSLPGKSCVIFINLAEKYRPKTLEEKRMGTNREEGAPICDGDPKPES
ncbi:MAG: type IV pilin protein [Gemmatimonadaceae bacterium]